MIAAMGYDVVTVNVQIRDHAHKQISMATVSACPHYIYTVNEQLKTTTTTTVHENTSITGDENDGMMEK